RLNRGRSRRVVLDWARQRERRRGVAGLIGAGPARGDAASVGPAVGERGAAHGPRGGVAAAPADRDRVVVPTVYVREANRRRRGGDRRGRVVLEREGGRRCIAGLVGAGRARRGAGAVGAAVGGGARAACDPGRRIAAVPADGDRTPVPAFGVRGQGRGGSGDRWGRVVLEREGGRGRIARLVGAGGAQRGVGAVGGAVGGGAGAASNPRGLVAAVPADG